MAKTSVERTLETLVDFADIHRRQMKEMGEHFDQSMERVTASIDALAVQVASFGSPIRELKELNRQTNQRIDKLTDQIAQLTDAVNGHLEVAKQQSSNISELTKLVATQASTVNLLIEKMNK